ncbi:MAG: SAM-dependent chlorinase/fluorinase [Oscillochloris sp.]|nr:SAM-dependent chlorinase/fluorinase [Oscillochloris sp.]
MIITFLTDFGLRDAYVGAMKGVALTVAPQATLIDITHLVPPQDVRTAALLLADYVPFYPSGSVHVAVVDPGVGSARRSLAIRLDLDGAQHTLVLPDNGLAWPLLQQATAYRAVVLREPRFWLPQVSSTFHGRDIFTPVAAHLALGLDLVEFGPPAGELVRLEIPLLRREGERIIGHVVTIDHFGNCASSIRRSDLVAGVNYEVWIAGRNLGPLRRTFADVAPGAALALFSSSGRVEVALRDGNAAQVLGITCDTELELRATRAMN